MKNFKFVHETPEHFVLHNGKSHFHVAKMGLDQPTADRIRALAEGGEVGKQPLPELPPTDLEDIYKATPIPEPEKEKPRKREIEVKEEAQFAHGGKLDANARAHIAEHNFALPGGRYPIHDISHARNALARVSQHGTAEEKKQVRDAVHKKYPGIEQSHAEGGEVPHDKKNLGQLEKSFDKFIHEEAGQKLADGGEPKPEIKDDLGVGDEISMFSHKMDVTNPEDRAKYSAMKQLKKEAPSLPMFDDGGSVQSFQDSFRKATHYADGGQAATSDVQEALSHAAKDPQHPSPPPPPDEETARQAKYEAIRKQNRANMGYAEGGHVQHGKYHFHFYDGAVIPTPLDKYVGGEPANGTPLDKEVRNYAEGDTVTLSPADIDPNAKLNLPQAPKPDFSTAEPTPVESANNLASAMGQTTPFSEETPSTTTVEPSKQISAAPKASAPTPDQNPSLLSEFDKALTQEKLGITQSALAQQTGQEQAAKLIGENVIAQQKAQQDYEENAKDITAENNHLFDNIKNGKIDPNQYWNNQSTGSKIAATLGVILGGLSGGITGKGDNPGLAMLQSHIQRDIDAQKDNLTNQTNLYKIGLERYRDERSARQFATLQANTLLQGQLAKVAANTNSQQVVGQMNQMIGQLGVQNASIRSDLAIKQAAMQSMNGPQANQPGGVDPNKVRLLIAAGVVPKEEVPKVMKEYDDYEKLQKTLDHTDNVFKQAQANSTYSERALPHWTPTIRDKSKQYEAVTDAWLGNITKDTEGRVTPADIELMKASLPKAGDSPELVKTKLNNIKDMIRQKYSFGSLQTYKLLPPNDSTATSTATRQKRFTEGPPK